MMNYAGNSSNRLISVQPEKPKRIPSFRFFYIHRLVVFVFGMAS
ncbi:hypothetical protein RT43_GL001844 [Enterococcus italicus DSM 15952]|nr:hypothetical protein RT43_GL001844 [Enterococcus italicus DSM 15952]